MDGIAPAVALAGLSPAAPGWSLSGIGASGLAAASSVLLFVYLIGRFIWMYNKEAAASAAASSLPVARPHRTVLLSLLPVFVHMASPDGAERAAECAVCLSEFRKREAGRLLPGCGHGFHEECIVTWLRLNTTCPLCRAAVAPKIGDASEA